MSVDGNDEVDFLSVLVFGAALVDYTIEVPDTFLLKYNLESNATYNLSVKPELRVAVREALDVNPEKVVKTPGGFVFNTVRFFRWLEKKHDVELRTSHSGTNVGSLVKFIGVIGQDDDADWLKQVANEEQLFCTWVTNRNEVTGKCNALICGTNRCLISEGGANEIVHEGFFSPEVQSVLNQSDCVYTSAYLFLHESSYTSVLEVFHSFRMNSKLVFLNLASHNAFQNEQFAKRVKEILNFCDFVTGNDSEFCALFKEQLNLNSLTVKETVLNFLELENISYKFMTFIITKGASETIVVQVQCTPDGVPNVTVESFEVEKIPDDEIRDTSGAGDAFMAGMLFGISRKLGLPEVIKLAHGTASFCIRSIGASLTT